MIHAKILSKNEKIGEVNKILKEVYVDELNYNSEDIFNTEDKEIINVLLYEGFDEDTPVAAGRMIVDGNRAEIKYVAVRKNYRNNQYGDMIIRVLVDKATLMTISDIIANVPENLTKMFKKIGFVSIDNNMKKDINNNIEMKFNNLIKNCNKIYE